MQNILLPHMHEKVFFYSEQCAGKLAITRKRGFPPEPRSRFMAYFHIYWAK